MTTKGPFSKIIAGAMTWGQRVKGFSKKETADLIGYCADIGLTSFDHADIYGGYTTESDFGNGFVSSGVKREQIQLISKCGIQMDSQVRVNSIKHYDYSTAYIISSVERSLKALKNRLSRPVAAASANQVEFSLTANGVMYDGTLDDCIENNRLAMSWSPFGSYFREKSSQVKRIKKVLKPLIEKYAASADQLLLAWILKHSAGVHPVVGTTTKGRLKDALRATEIKMEIEDWFVLLAASQGHEVP